MLVPVSALVCACGTLLGATPDETPSGADGAAHEGGEPDAVVGGDAAGDDASSDGGEDARIEGDADAGARRVFVTSTPWLVGGVTAPDTFCNDLARAAKLDGGTGGFVAWLSYSAALPAAARLNGEGPWVDTQGHEIAKNRAALLSGTLEVPISYVEDGSPLSVIAAFTGTNADGGWSGHSCGMWDSTSGLDTEGHSDSTTSEWTDFGGATAFASCAAVNHHLYCFEQP